ncbi:MAG: Leucyl/phenylalanyl-tRNA--protein transferase [Marmoricola sp.]|nr:Leucyl/phenylalanyl-tRNA--protein transferase [Marmoricola sp.]MCW2820870.1 Leucyl/phenylalanyl-tRNA--protein transferase [Marmoricola sp.]MCW2827391.1 Leucyl/phenylalanyl-tRNA--protein transferase [Marmoricola sp.]
MPVEPSPTPWAFPPADSGDGDLVAIGADLAPGTVLAAYRRGLFPMAVDSLTTPGRVDMAWWSPEQRGVLPLSSLRVSRSLRQSASHFDIRVNTSFSRVLEACADPSRSGGWIDDAITAAYTELHRLGWAHSVEAWRDGRLAGGLYGVAIGGLFAGESMFTRARDGSKVALLGLVDLLRDEYADRRLLDTQWRTEHLASLGVEEVPRSEYLARLQRALELPLPVAFGG